MRSPGVLHRGACPVCSRVSRPARFLDRSRPGMHDRHGSCHRRRQATARLPAIIASGGGSIINMASNVALMGVSGRDCNAAAKGGIAAMTSNARCNAFTVRTRTDEALHGWPDVQPNSDYFLCGLTHWSPNPWAQSRQSGSHDPLTTQPLSQSNSVASRSFIASAM
jgi:hypothetical protein